MSARKEVKQLVSEAASQGWRIDERGNRVMLFSPDGESKVTLHMTPSDHRWKKNALSALRNGGFNDTKGKKGKSR